MATSEVHEEVRAIIRKRIRSDRQRLMKIIPERPDSRVPVDGLDAHKVAGKYLNLRKPKIRRL